MKRFFTCILLFSLCFGIGCDGIDRDFDDPDLAPSLPEPTLTIAGMQALYDGTNALTFTTETRIGGVVTASDESGNFYRSFVIEDQTGGAEIMAGLYDLHTLYPVGREVRVDLRGLTLSRTDGGMVQLGVKALPSSGYTVDYIGHSALLDYYVSRGGMSASFRAAEVTIPELNDGLLGCLVTIRRLTLRNGGETTWATVEGRYPKDIRATDPDENWLYIYTSGYADFAGDTIPAAVVSISGILMKNGNRYRIKMRDLRDVEVY